MAAWDDATERLGGPPVSVTLSGSSGRMIQIEGVTRPVIGLREGVQRGWALVHGVSERLDDGRAHAVAPGALNAVDLERIDTAAIEQVLAVLPPAQVQDRPPLLFLPMALATARNPRARKRILRMVAEAEPRLRMVAICELYGIERGSPVSVLREVAGALRPIFRGALPHMGADSRSVAQVVDCGFSGAAVEAGELTEARDEEAMLRTVLSLQRVGPGVMFHGVRSVGSLTAVRVAGASWASLDILTGGVEAARLAAQMAAPKETAARSPRPPLVLENA